MFALSCGFAGFEASGAVFEASGAVFETSGAVFEACGAVFEASAAVYEASAPNCLANCSSGLIPRLASLNVIV